MDENNRADKEVLTKGFKQLGICLILMFTGPTLLHLTLNNKDKPLYIPLFIASILLCIFAIFLLFKGINTILDSIFKKK